MPFLCASRDLREEWTWFCFLDLNLTWFQNVLKSWFLSLRPKVGSNITVTIENMKNDVPFAVCTWYPAPMSGTAHLCNRRASGPGRNHKIKDHEGLSRMGFLILIFIKNLDIIIPSCSHPGISMEFCNYVSYAFTCCPPPPPHHGPDDPQFAHLPKARCDLNCEYFPPNRHLWSVVLTPSTLQLSPFYLVITSLFSPYRAVCDFFLVQCTGKWRKRGVHVLCCCHDVAMGSDCVSRVKAAVDTKKRPQSW